MPDIGPMELILLLAIVLLLFGPGKLPEVGKSLGNAIREFRKATTDVQDAARGTQPATQAPAAPATVAQAASAAPAPGPAVSPAPAPVAAPATVAATFAPPADTPTGGVASSTSGEPGGEDIPRA